MRFLTGLLRAHLKRITSRWRALPAGRIEVIVLAAPRHDQRLADLAGGNSVSRTTVDRWLKEMIGLLAARAPRLEQVLARIARSGGSVVLLDGSLIPTQRRAGIPAGVGAGGPQPARDRPLTDGLHHRQAPTTSTSTASPAHATPVACTFRLNTAQW
ncbi:hypothetical protein ACFV7R_35245 [Streptomyces sp. NPDC059866]|uniref:hypothetical protein n=1 Tax=Streptomyces sp. NPDC059866 TaxID=3346978 RepID=UPI003659798A